MTKLTDRSTRDITCKIPCKLTTRDLWLACVMDLHFIISLFLYLFIVALWLPPQHMQVPEQGMNPSHS